MPQIPQPLSLEWSPTTTPLAEPSWESLDNVWDVVVDRDMDKPGTAAVKLRNGSSIDTSAHPLTDWRRWTRGRVMLDFGSGANPALTGHIKKLDHDTKDMPFASRVEMKLVDALDIWNQNTFVRELLGDDIPTGFLGFDTTVAALAAELDAAATAIGSPVIIGNARAPITLPADLGDGSGVKFARFREIGLAALRKALDVEMGNVHISTYGLPAIVGRYAVPVTASSFGPQFKLTDDASAINGSTVFGYLRESLEFADPIDEYHNGSNTAGLQKKTHTSSVALDLEEPPDSLDVLDMWTRDECWVEANARHLAKMYAGVKVAWPTQISVPLWDTAMTSFSLADLVQQATEILGRFTILVELKLPGLDRVQWQSTIVGLKLTATQSQLIATLKLGVNSQRWADVYGNTLFSLDDATRGLDTAAILGP